VVIGLESLRAAPDAEGDVALEPKLVERIRKHRRSVRWQKVLVVAPFVVTVALGVAVLVVSLVLVAVPGLRDESGDTRVTMLYFVMTMFIVCGAALFAFANNLFGHIAYAGRRFDRFVGDRAEDPDGPALMKFTEALDGACIAAGEQRPELVVLDDPAPNALAFVEDGQRYVAVTSGMLSGDFSVSEANAVMAHELAHLMIGENVRRPRFFDIEFLPNLSLFAFGALALAAMIVTWFLNSIVATVVVIASPCIFIALFGLTRSSFFAQKTLLLAYQHDDLLADAVAASITRDPAALRSAIRKVEAVQSVAERSPGGTVMTRYLFVTPPLSSGDYARYATRIGRAFRTWGTVTSELDAGQRELYELERQNNAARLVNLDVIEHGTVRSTADWEKGD